MNETTTLQMKLPSDQDISGRTLGSEELAMLTQAIQEGTLTSTKGSMTKEFEGRFSQMLSVNHAHATSSGTAALHTAIAAIDPEPGEEIITSPITDMGAITPILYQGAIPVFADVDPATCNVTAETIERAISENTRAIIVTHLFGNPCEMQRIMEVARSRQIPVIEDCAQAFLAKHGGQYVGTIGDIGCFSLQQGKHITTGEGGVVTTNDTALGRRMFLFINKAWGYGDANPDHYFLALNYRMSELQGAVARAQLDKLEGVVHRRMEAAEVLSQKLESIAGVHAPAVRREDRHTYWKYVLRVEGSMVKGGAVGLGQQLRKRGIACAPRYIQKPAFMCEIFQKKRTFGQSQYPFTLARPEAVCYERAKYPGTFSGLDQIVVLPWNEKYTSAHVNYLAGAVEDSVADLLAGGNGHTSHVS